MTTKILLIALSLSSFAHIVQSQVIQGKITDVVTNSPLPGANIIINTDNKGTISALDGTYQIAVPEPGNYTISCSFMGYIAVKKTITVADSIVKVNFVLVPDSKQLDEVIIQGEITSPVKRTGDATNKEKIDAYTLSYMGVKYSLNNVLFIKSFQVGIEIKNVFDTKYVGSINASDDSNQGSATYFAGIPRCIIGSISLTF